MFIVGTPKNFLKRLFPAIVWALSITCFLLFVHFLFTLYSSKELGTVADGIDFNAYLTGASVLKENPKFLYNENIQKEKQKYIIKQEIDGLLSYRNNPLVAAIYLPYTFLKPRNAYIANHLVQIVFVVGYILVLRKLTGINKLFVPIFLLFTPTIFQPMYGQIAILIAFIYALIFHFFKSEKYFLAGLISSLFMLKFQYLIAIPYLIIYAKNKKRFLTGLLLSSALLVGIDSLIYGGFYLPDYIRFLLRTENYNNGTDTLALYNLIGFTRLLKIPETFGYAVSIISLLFTLLVTWIYRKKITPEVFIVSLILWNISITPHAALVDLIFLLIPISIFIKTPGKLSKILAGILFIVPLTFYFGLQGPAGIVLFLVGCLNYVVIINSRLPDIARTKEVKSI